MNPFELLGLPNNASKDDAKKAFRKLASKHHPDHGGDRAKFQAYKAAYEQIEGGYRVEPPRKAKSSSTGFGWHKPHSPGDTWRDQDIGSIFEEMKTANKNAAPNYNPFTSDELVATTTLREAFAGFSMVIPRHHNGGVVTQSTVHIPPGVPNGYRGKYQVSDGRFVYITTRIDTGNFKVRSFDDQNNLFSAGLQIGDIEIEVPVNAIDVITGGWFTTQDFLGESLKVRLPAGFNPLHRLKIAGKGYYGWDSYSGQPLRKRMDMYVRLNVEFTSLEKIETAKKINLYKTIQAMVPECQ